MKQKPFDNPEIFSVNFFSYLSLKKSFWNFKFSFDRRQMQLFIKVFDVIYCWSFDKSFI